jgi:predicted DNA-binding transcriptional regulator YafY
MAGVNETLLRQWQMLRQIPRYPGKISARELNDRLAIEQFEVSKRTVERDLQELSLKFPLSLDDREKPYGWSWQKDAAAFDLPGLGPHEALMLKLVQAHLKNLLPASTLKVMAPYFKSAEQRLNSISPDSKVLSWQKKVRSVTATQPLLAPIINEAVQTTITQALLIDRQLKIIYNARNKESNQYRIHPLALVQRGSVTYLFVRINDFEDTRLLALHRIHEAELLDERTIIPVDFDIDAEISSGRMGFGQGKLLSLIAKFSLDAGDHLFETPLSIDQTIVKDNDRLTVTATVADTPQLVWWLLSFGAGVEVVAPTVLRTNIATTLTDAAKKYLV